ncbi:hypothetical protein F1880_004361 [Penicillium rolfsii]|nr:hypothetical protein F1880_004361 [Penicillium rolfsii]
MTDKTDTTEDLTQLNTAIVRVSKEVLVSLLWEICETNPSARDFVKGRLFVDENEVPRPGSQPDSVNSRESEDSDASDDNNDKVNSKPTATATTGVKRLRTRFAQCTNCNGEFDVTENTKKSCTYHPDLAVPDYDRWPDHDENCHGPIDTEENLRQYPESFTYQCCDRYGDEEPCVTDWHRERVYENETSKRQRF